MKVPVMVIMICHMTVTAAGLGMLSQLICEYDPNKSDEFLGQKGRVDRLELFQQLDKYESGWPVMFRIATEGFENGASCDFHLRPMFADNVRQCNGFFNVTGFDTLRKDDLEIVADILNSEALGDGPHKLCNSRRF